MKLSVIIVSYNANELLRKCLASIYKQTKNILFEVIVVDNASTDGSQEMIQEEFPKVKLILNVENTGFAAANNIGIRQSDGEYILLLNPDTEILDGAIQKAASFMEKNPKIGIAGCRLLFPDGSLQRSVRSFPTAWSVFCESTFLYLLYPLSTVFGKYYRSYFYYSSPTQVDWVLGAFMMVNKRVIDTIGLLDEQFYMYSEEVDYCCRAKNAGYEIWYTPEGEIIHYWSGVNAINRRVML